MQLSIGLLWSFLAEVKGYKKMKLLDDNIMAIFIKLWLKIIDVNYSGAQFWGFSIWCDQGLDFCVALNDDVNDVMLTEIRKLLLVTKVPFNNN